MEHYNIILHLGAAGDGVWIEDGTITRVGVVCKAGFPITFTTNRDTIT